MPMLVCVAVRAKTILVLRMPGFSREIELAHLDMIKCPTNTCRLAIDYYTPAVCIGSSTTNELSNRNSNRRIFTGQNRHHRPYEVLHATAFSSHASCRDGISSEDFDGLACFQNAGRSSKAAAGSARVPTCCGTRLHRPKPCVPLSYVRTHTGVQRPVRACTSPSIGRP
jgi:hypothetical protein